MPDSLKKKFDYIYNYERIIGNSVALRVIQPKPIGVWEFLIPIFFILNFMRNKQSREVFIQNYMFTKRQALDAAFKMLKNGLSREDAFASIKAQTRSLLSAPGSREIYSESIRQQQMAEMNLLVDHYGRLLKAQGTDYVSLVRRAYKDRQNYAIFHEQLLSAEKKVSEAAQRTLGPKADVAALLRIEKTTEEIRKAQIEKIFAT